MPDQKRPLKVFLCHASTDKPKVRELYRYLKKRGIQPWFDEEDLVGGQDWQVEILKALATSDATIVCITKNSINKEGYVQKEIKFALDRALEMPEGRNFLIPVRYEECEVPPSLSRYQWINIFLPDGYEKLFKTLRNRADQIGALPPYLEEATPYKPLRRIFIAFIIGVFIIGTLLAPMLAKGIPIIEYYLTVPTPTTTVTVAPYVTALLPANTVIKETTSASAQNSMPTEITDAKGVSMMLVPAGEFIMGSNYDSADERPVHNVFLESYYIDKYEVSNSLYKDCVDAGLCLPPDYFGSIDNNSYYDNPYYDGYPVIHVNWYMANTYCEWRNARLPTEAEWEKAARGDSDHIFPWGNFFDENKANFCDVNCIAPWSGDSKYNDKYAGTAPVNAYPEGVSIYGVYGMAGNVWEWVSSLYYPYPYDVSDGRENINATGDRVLRGGSFNNETYRVRLSLRFQGSPAIGVNNFGFRCARDVNP